MTKTNITEGAIADEIDRLWAMLDGPLPTDVRAQVDRLIADGNMGRVLRTWALARLESGRE